MTEVCQVSAAGSRHGDTPLCPPSALALLTALPGKPLEGGASPLWFLPGSRGAELAAVPVRVIERCSRGGLVFLQHFPSSENADWV